MSLERRVYTEEITCLQAHRAVRCFNSVFTSRETLPDVWEQVKVSKGKSLSTVLIQWIRTVVSLWGSATLSICLNRCIVMPDDSVNQVMLLLPLDGWLQLRFCGSLD